MKTPLMLRRFFAITLFFVAAGESFAQPGGGGDPGSGEPVPIQGLIYLLVAGAFLGIRRLAKRKN